jgi:hypothetical protein
LTNGHAGMRSRLPCGVESINQANQHVEQMVVLL